VQHTRRLAELARSGHACAGVEAKLHAQAIPVPDQPDPVGLDMSPAATEYLSAPKSQGTQPKPDISPAGSAVAPQVPLDGGGIGLLRPHVATTGPSPASSGHTASNERAAYGTAASASATTGTAQPAPSARGSAGAAATVADARVSGGGGGDALLGDGVYGAGEAMLPERPQGIEVSSGTIVGAPPCKSVFEVLIVSDDLSSFLKLASVRPHAPCVVCCAHSLAEVRSSKGCVTASA
jgi:hypothetical protein